MQHREIIPAEQAVLRKGNSKVFFDNRISNQTCGVPIKTTGSRIDGTDWDRIGCPILSASNVNLTGVVVTA